MRSPAAIPGVGVVQVVSGEPERQLSLLRELYRASTGNTRIGLGAPTLEDCSRRALLSRHEGEQALAWLVDTELVVQRAVSGALYLSHAGVKEIEDSYAHPEEGTAHFPASVIRSVAPHRG